MKQKSDKQQLVPLSGGNLLDVSSKQSQEELIAEVLQTSEDFSQIELNTEQQKRLQKHMASMSTGAYAAVPLICSEKCPFKQKCPLFLDKKAPFGLRCPIEELLLRKIVVQYIEEFDIDPSSRTELSLVSELAEIEIYQMRISSLMASSEEYAGLMITQDHAGTMDGDIISKLEVNPLVDLKDRLMARRHRILKLLVADPQEKYKKQAALKQVPKDDYSTEMARIAGEIRTIKGAIEESKSRLHLESKKEHDTTKYVEEDTDSEVTHFTIDEDALNDLIGADK